MTLGGSCLPYHLPILESSSPLPRALGACLLYPTWRSLSAICARRMMQAVPSSRAFCIHSKTNSHECLLLPGTGGGPEQRKEGRRDRACSSWEMERNTFPAGTGSGSPGELGPKCQLGPLGSHHQDGIRKCKRYIGGNACDR